MTFPIPAAWRRPSADAQRDEEKRSASPCSFFYSQAQSLTLTAQYFVDDRLSNEARGGVAIKHRHRMQLALFGQMMASFEYMLKDFVAKSVDATTVLDQTILKAGWTEVTAAKILASRSTATTPGAMLIHSTLGWHTPGKVNERYKELFAQEPIESDKIADLERLWILRHSVAHNSGYITDYDSSRLGAPALASSVVRIDASFIDATKWFLVPIARRVAEVVGGALLSRWFASVRPEGQDYVRDKETFKKLKQLATMVDSRTRDVPEPTEQDYQNEFGAA